LATPTLEQHAQGVVLSASINSLEWMARFLAGLGCPFTVRQPIELKGALQGLASELIQMAQ
ncbi:MAG TPA: WYL domain-containing protein, partial [Ktedonobacteraceae bacterium]|nr:WYL domain-containing protein [Ktedonobacteraceae bacterium]